MLGLMLICPFSDLQRMEGALAGVMCACRAGGVDVADC